MVAGFRGRSVGAVTGGARLGGGVSVDPACFVLASTVPKNLGLESTTRMASVAGAMECSYEHVNQILVDSRLSPRHRCRESAAPGRRP